MSLEIAKQQVKEFLSSPEPECLVIKGKWGVGKTYFWNQQIKEAKKIALKKYCYVSLFGINSIQDLRRQIFSNTIDINLIGTSNLDAIREAPFEKISSLFRKTCHLTTEASKGLADKYFGINLSVDLTSLLSFLDNDLIMCVDDFERKSENLSSDDILGLVSSLKEEKKCKIVFIFNEERFDPKTAEVYSKFKEKVVDELIIFNPTPEETLAISLESAPGKQQGSASIKDLILEEKDFISQIEISNIRIMRKIIWLAEKLRVIIFPDYQAVIKVPLQSLILFCWTYYTDKKNFELLKNFNATKYNKNEKNENSFVALLTSLKYYYTENIDLIIAEAVECGFFDEEKLLQETKALLQKQKYEKENARVLEEFDQAWKPFREYFKDNKEEVISSVYDCFKKNCRYCSPTILEQTVNLFRGLGEDDKAKELIDYFIKENHDKKFFNINNFHMLMMDVKDKEIIEAFKKRIEASRKKPILKEMLDEMVRHDFFTNEQTEFLMGIDKKEFFDIFKKEGFEKTSSYARKLIDMRIQNAIAALKEIAKENQINELRVQYLGILVDR